MAENYRVKFCNSLGNLLVYITGRYFPETLENSGKFKTKQEELRQQRIMSSILAEECELSVAELNASNAAFDGLLYDKQQLQEDYNGLEKKAKEESEIQTTRYGLLEEELAKQIDIYGLAEREKERYKELCSQALIELGGARAAYDTEKIENTKIRAEISKTKDLASKVLRISRGIANGEYVRKLTIDVISEREREKASSVSALTEWKNTTEKILVGETKVAKAIASAYENQNIMFGMNFAIKYYRKIPFVYYDFLTKKLVPTQAAARLLHVDLDAEEKIGLKTLLRHIDKSGRKDVVESLKSGKRLEHYQTKSSAKNPVNLVLTTHPFIYENKPRGVGVFLYDPRFSLKKIGVWNLGRVLDKIFEEISEEMSEFKEKIKGSVKEKIRERFKGPLFQP